MSKRWVEEEVPPPIDLRLVPMAIAVWAGCLVGLGTGAPQSSAVAWTGAATAALGVLVLCRRGPRRAGSLVVAAGFGAAMLISMLDWHAAATNPLTAAAASGSWASVTLTVSVPARKLPDLFPGLLLRTWRKQIRRSRSRRPSGSFPGMPILRSSPARNSNRAWTSP